MSSFELARWKEQHCPDAKGSRAWQKGSIYTLDVCPFNSEHNDRTFSFGQRANGALFARCLHSSCSQYKWRDFRALKEPGWEDRSNGKGRPVSPNGIDNTDTVSEEGPPIPPRVEVPQPFPIEALPKPLARLAREGAAAFPCPPDFIAVPALTICGSVIGRSRVLEVKPGWLEGPRIWSAFVAKPGEKKSPVLSMVQRALERQQSRLQRENEAARETFESDCARYQVELTAWAEAVKKAARSGGAPPGEKPREPQEPRMRQVFTSDSTVEALCELLQENPRGLIFLRDELTGWARAMDQYKGGKGSDRQAWLSFWSGAALLVNRKGRKQPIFLTDPFVSVAGCLPPEVLNEFTDERGREDGFIHRLLFSYPEPVAVTWTEAFVGEDTLAAYEKLLDGLANLAPGKDEHGNAVPKVVNFAAAGKTAWVQWVNAHYAELADPLFSDALRGPWSKMDGYCASYALVLQEVRFVMGEADSEKVDAISVAAAASLIDYHKSHARRVYPLLRASQEDQQIMHALKWVERQEGRTTTARQILTYKVGGAQKIADAKKLLCELADRGYGEIKEESRNSLRFTLIDLS